MNLLRNLHNTEMTKNSLVSVFIYKMYIEHMYIVKHIYAYLMVDVCYLTDIFLMIITCLFTLRGEFRQNTWF